MKKAKRILSLVLCLVLLTSAFSVSAFALDTGRFKHIPYKCYTYIGDSIAWGFGLDSGREYTDPENVCSREEGAYGDLIGKLIEERNDGTTHAAAASGARLCDYRVAIERGMGKADPYEHDDWYSEKRAPERTEKLRSLGRDMCDWIAASDLITLQLGYNDILAAPLFTLQDSPMMDEMLALLDDPNAGTLELSNGMKNLLKGFGSVILDGMESFRVNTYELIKDINEINGKKADIVLVGYYNPYKELKESENSDLTPFLDAISVAVAAMNDYFSEIADMFDNVYYVDVMDVSLFFPDGMLFSEAQEDGDAMLLGAHPDEAGHVYIAKQILTVLEKVNTCPLYGKDTFFSAALFFPDNMLKTIAKVLASIPLKILSSIFPWC